MTDSAAMSCPICRVPLVMSERQGVEIDYCPQCRGVWLDRGELDKIIERNAQDSAPRAAQRCAPIPILAAASDRSYSHHHRSGRPSPEAAQVVPRRAVRLEFGDRVERISVSVAQGWRPTASATVATRGRSPSVIERPPVRRRNARSARSQRGAQARGSGRSATTMSASAQARTISVPARRDGGVRVARMRQRRPPRSMSAAHRSGLQAAVGRRSSSTIFGLGAGQLRPACRGHNRRRAGRSRASSPLGGAQDEMAAVAGDERSGAGVASAQSGAERDRDERRAGASASATGRSTGRPPTIRAKAPRGIAGSRATAPGARGGGVGEPEQQGERLAGQPPEGRAEADQVEQQGQRLERHDDEGGERDGDDVGERRRRGRPCGNGTGRSASARSRRRGR